MTVEAATPTVEGAVFWQVVGMEDFSPAFASPFSVAGDGLQHEYDVALAPDMEQGKSIVRMRLDPSNVPGKIRIDSIKILCKN